MEKVFNILNYINNGIIRTDICKLFLYVIRDKKTSEIWFVETVYEPNTWENDKANYQYR